jgi:hypothetical protein
MNEEIMQVQLQDHENRLRKLEESDIRQQIQLANIEKGNAEIKVMINESNKDFRSDLKENQTVLLEIIKDNNNTNKTIKLNNNKQTWTTIASILALIGTIIAYIFK